MLGVTAAGSQALPKLASTVRALPHARWADVAVSAGVIVVVVAARRVSRRIPGLLIAVIIAIIVSWAASLRGHGVPVVGTVPRGLPSLGLPALGRHDVAALLGVAVSMFVVILAQSAATSRAYAAKYEEPFSEATDLVGLGAANAAAAFSGTFVVNGSPTKTQIVDSAGGRSQLSQLAACRRGPDRPGAADRAAGLPARCRPGGGGLPDRHRAASTSRGCGASWPCASTSSPWPCSRRSRWWPSGSSTASRWPSSPRSSTTCGTATARSTASW